MQAFGKQFDSGDDTVLGRITLRLTVGGGKQKQTMQRDDFRLPQDVSPSDLPSLPTIANEILRLGDDPNAGVADIAEVIGMDVSLSAKLLRLANTPHYRRGKEITTISQAVVTLGSKAVRLLALSFSLAESMPKPQGELNFAAYWKHCVTTAVAARCLARATKLPCGEEAFLCGLISRIGQLTMASCMEELYSPVLEKCENDLPVAEFEREELGFDFHQVGAYLARSWGLPEKVCQVVHQWDEPTKDWSEDDDLTRRICCLVHVADCLATVVVAPHKARALLKANELARECFGLAVSEVEAFFLTLQDEVLEIAKLFNLDVPYDYQSILERARRQLIEVSLSTVEELDQTRRLAQALENANEELDAATKTDSLTQLANRAFFDQRLTEVIEARMVGQCSNAIGLLMMDIDQFKSLNDTHGHQVGDEVLKSVAFWLTRATRDTDFIARYGGEEFVAIVPNTTLPALEAVAERLRRTVEKGVVKTPTGDLRVTMSFGGACVARVTCSEEGKELLRLADECLYEAKTAGRNCCVCQEVQFATSK